MGEIYYPIAGVTILSLISLVVTLAPGPVQELTQGAVNTSELQSNTEFDDPSANATSNTLGLVDQAGDLANVLSSPESGNRLLGILFSIIGIGLIAWLIVVLVPG